MPYTYNKRSVRSLRKLRKLNQIEFNKNFYYQKKNLIKIKKTMASIDSIQKYTSIYNTIQVYIILSRYLHYQTTQVFRNYLVMVYADIIIFYIENIATNCWAISNIYNDYYEYNIQQYTYNDENYYRTINLIGCIT